MRGVGGSSDVVEQVPGRAVRVAAARDRVSGIQRVRILSAMVAEVSERGMANVTVAHVVARAGVSRRTFYETFRDREECFLAALDDAVGRVAREVAPAYERPDRWREQIREGLIAALSFLQQEPAFARLLVVESLGGGPRTLRRRSKVLALVVSAVDEGRAHAKDGLGPPSMMAEGVVGAALSIVHARLTEGESPPLIELVNPLMSMIVLPYHGAAASRRELGRPLPKLGEVNGANGANPLHELDMRLTYRTVRVLIAVAANSGSSNRALADAAGISDQGQISKLLTRLQGLGLIVKVGVDSAPGGPNAWMLTAKGWEVHGVIDTQATLS